MSCFRQVFYFTPSLLSSGGGEEEEEQEEELVLASHSNGPRGGSGVPGVDSGGPELVLVYRGACKAWEREGAVLCSFYGRSLCSTFNSC